MADSLTNFVTMGRSITGQSCMGVIIYAHLSQSALVCNSLLVAFIGIANQCLGMLYLNSLWNSSSPSFLYLLFPLCIPHSVSICFQPVVGSLSSYWTATPASPCSWALVQGQSGLDEEESIKEGQGGGKRECKGQQPRNRDQIFYQLKSTNRTIH